MGQAGRWQWFPCPEHSLKAHTWSLTSWSLSCLSTPVAGLPAVFLSLFGVRQVK